VGFYHPYEGRILFEGRDRTRDCRRRKVAELGVARTLSGKAVALFKGMGAWLDNLMTGRLLEMGRPHSC